MRKYIYPLLLIILTVITPLPRAFAQTGSNYNPLNDAFVSDFKNYQTYGGTTNIPVKNITYTMNIPSGFNFDPKSDIIQIILGLNGGASTTVYQSVNEKDCIKDASNNYVCKLTWDVEKENFIKPYTVGEHSVSFVVLDSNTQKKGRVFFDLFNGLYTPLYAQSGSIFIEQPLTTVGATFKNASNNITITEKGNKPVISVITNALNNPKSVEFFLNNISQGSTSNSITETNGIYTGTQSASGIYSVGQASIFNYTLDNLDNLSNGSYKLTATLKGDGYSVAVTNNQFIPNINVVIANKEIDPTCKSKLLTLNEITSSAISKKSEELKDIELIDAKVRNYFVSKPFKLNTYGNLIKDLDSKDMLAQSSLVSLLDKSIFTCDKDFNQQTQTFLGALDSSYASLSSYRDNVLNFISIISEAEGTN